MTAEQLEAETPIAGPNSPFIFVNTLPIPGSPGSFGFGGRSNECASVEVSGDGFTLAAAQRSSVIATAGDDGVIFRPFRTIARFAQTSTPHYWVAPLLNFIVDFRRAVPQLQDHPLRTRATTPFDASEGPLRLYHESFYREGNALIPFLCEGEPAFIEPLPDLTARRARVEAGESTITAVAVGRTPDGFDLDASDWFPGDLPTQDREFVPQHEQFDVFHVQAAAATNERPQHGPDGEVEEGENHASDPPNPPPPPRRPPHWRPSGPADPVSAQLR